MPGHSRRSVPAPTPEPSPARAPHPGLAGAAGNAAAQDRLRELRAAREADPLGGRFDDLFVAPPAGAPRPPAAPSPAERPVPPAAGVPRPRFGLGSVLPDAVSAPYGAAREAADRLPAYSYATSNDTGLTTALGGPSAQEAGAGGGRAARFLGGAGGRALGLVMTPIGVQQGLEDAVTGAQRVAGGDAEGVVQAAGGAAGAFSAAQGGASALLGDAAAGVLASGTTVATAGAAVTAGAAAAGLAGGITLANRGQAALVDTHLLGARPGRGVAGAPGEGAGYSPSDRVSQLGDALRAGLARRGVGRLADVAGAVSMLPAVGPAGMVSGLAGSATLVREEAGLVQAGVSAAGRALAPVPPDGAAAWRLHHPPASGGTSWLEGASQELLTRRAP